MIEDLPITIRADDAPALAELRRIDRAMTRLIRSSCERCRRPRRRWPWFVLLGFVLGLVCGTQLHAAEPRVSLQVRPRIMLRRGDIRLETRVPRNADNRLLAIAWTSDVGSEGSTLEELAGDDAAVLYTKELRAQPPANYLFVATVIDRTGKTAGTDRAEIRVPDVGGDR